MSRKISDTHVAFHHYHFQGWLWLWNSPNSHFLMSWNTLPSSILEPVNVTSLGNRVFSGVISLR